MMIRTRSITTLIIVGIVAVFCSCNSNQKKTKKEVTLFVAASLTDVITEITNKYTLETGVEVKLNLASSGTLAKQLSQGASSDLYFSASQKWMDYAETEELIVKATRMSPAKNSLVLVVPKVDTITCLTCFEDLKGEGIERISIGDPAHVPAGKYAVSAMKSLAIYPFIETKLLPAKDVRSALMVVELGECNCGIVYKTDAMKSQKVNIAKVFPESSHAPIVYYGAICKETKANDLAVDLLSYIKGEASSGIWKKYGFELP